MPIQCEYYALEGLGQLLRNVDLVRRNLNPQLEVSTIVCVMYDARTKLADQVVRRCASTSATRCCGPSCRARCGCPRRRRSASRSSPSIHARAARSPTATSPRRCTMARRSGLGKGLSALIPTPSGTGGATAGGPAGADRDPGRRHRAQPAPAARALRRGVAGRAGGVDRTDRRAAAGPGASGRRTGYQLIAGERRWRAARRAGLATIPADRPPTDDVSRRRAGAGREPPPPGPHPARGGGRLPAADRGLRAHPRASRRPGRQEPLGDHQHAAAARAAAAIQHLLADGKLSAGHARALLGTPDRALQEQLARAGGRRGLVGAGGRGGGASAGRRPATGARRRPATPA